MKSKEIRRLEIESSTIFSLPVSDRPEPIILRLMLQFYQAQPFPFIPSKKRLLYKPYDYNFGVYSPQK